MESEAMDPKEAIKVKLAREITEAESHMKSLEALSGQDPDNLETSLEVASVYADISAKYAAKAVLDSRDGRMTSASQDAIREAQDFLRSANSEIGEKMNLRNYDAEKAEAIRSMGISGLESKFAKLESSIKTAKESIDMAVSSVGSLDTQLNFKTLSLTDEQAYMLAAAIEKSAKLAASDTNYGCGFLGTGREEEVEIRYRRKPEYMGMLMLKKEKAEEFLGQAVAD